MEEATGLLALAKDEAQLEFAIDMNKDRNAPMTGSCTGTLPTGKVWLGSPSEQGRRGPATRALLRWVEGHRIFPKL